MCGAGPAATVPPPKVHKTAVHAAAVTAKQNGEQCHCFANEDSAIGLCEGGFGSAGGPPLGMDSCNQNPLCHWGPEEDPSCAPAASTGRPPKTAEVHAKQMSGEQCHCFANEDSAIGHCEGGSGSAGGPGLPMGTCMQDPLCHWGPEEDPMCGAGPAATVPPPKHRLAAVLSATA